MSTASITIVDFELTEITELPGVLRDGVIQPLPVELFKLSQLELMAVAEAMGGILAYVKVRSTFTKVETLMCSTKGCFDPVGEKYPGSDLKSCKCATHAKLRKH